MPAALAALERCQDNRLSHGGVAFDVFLNTSLYEGLSIATLEAQAHGCPIVTADAGGQRECLREGDVLVEALEDDTAYAAAILRATRRWIVPAESHACAKPPTGHGPHCSGSVGP